MKKQELQLYLGELSTIAGMVGSAWVLQYNVPLAAIIFGVSLWGSKVFDKKIRDFLPAPSKAVINQMNKKSLICRSSAIESSDGLCKAMFASGFSMVTTNKGKSSPAVKMMAKFFHHYGTFGTIVTAQDAMPQAEQFTLFWVDFNTLAEKCIKDEKAQIIRDITAILCFFSENVEEVEARAFLAQGWVFNPIIVPVVIDTRNKKAYHLQIYPGKTSREKKRQQYVQDLVTKIVYRQ